MWSVRGGNLVKYSSTAAQTRCGRLLVFLLSGITKSPQYISKAALPRRSAALRGRWLTNTHLRTTSRACAKAPPAWRSTERPGGRRPRTNSLKNFLGQERKQEIIV